MLVPHMSQWRVRHTLLQELKNTSQRLEPHTSRLEQQQLQERVASQR
jgi:hypothetical protein